MNAEERPAGAGRSQDQQPGKAESSCNRTAPGRQPFADAAMGYARRGWPVFPCKPGGKPPLTRRGFKDAAADLTVVESWVAVVPDANVGAPTGIVFDALDVDIRPGISGFPGLHRLNHAGLLAGCVGQAETRNGGLHLYFPVSGHGCGSSRGRNLDFKAGGGYVLLPPSVVPADPGTTGTGNYSWRDPYDADIPTARPLDWAACKRLLEPSAETVRTRPAAHAGNDTGRATRLLSWLADQPEGNRNHGLYWVACQWFSHEIGDPAPLLETARSLGLRPSEISRTVESARRRAGAA